MSSPSRIFRITDGVAADVAAMTGLPANASVERNLTPGDDLAELQHAVILVWPRTRTKTSGTRATANNELLVDVAVLQQASPAQVAAGLVDSLMAFAESISDLYGPRSRVDGDAKWRRTIHGEQDSPLYAANRLRNDHLFVTVVSFQFDFTTPFPEDG